MRAIRKQYSGTARFVLEILGDKHIVQDQRLSPGKSRPTASASFLRFSPLSREPASRLSRPHRASFSSNAANRFGFTVGYDVWRIDATRYALTASDMITEVIWNARGGVPVQRGDDRVSISSGQSRCEGGEGGGGQETGERRVVRTERNSAKAAPWEWLFRLSSSSRKSTSRRRFAMAFSFIIGMSRPVRKSCEGAQKEE